jgi:hypothetical protein
MRIKPVYELQKGIAKIWMVLVGVDQYQDERLPNLDFAVADRDGLSTALEVATREFPRKEIRSLRTRDEICHGLSDLARDAERKDIILFYFSGHGALNTVDQQLYLCFPETNLDNLAGTALNVPDLLEQLKNISASRQVVILDACHSGTISSRLQDKGSYAVLSRSSSETAPPEEIPEPSLSDEFETVLHRYSTSTSKDFYALLSCSPGQRSYELREIQHGVFTYWLIQGLGAVSDASSDGRIDIKDLYTYVRDRTEDMVRKNGKLQRPSHISKGSQDIVIGWRPPQPHHLPYRQRVETYVSEYEKKLLEQYPSLNAKTWQMLEDLAQQLSIASNGDDIKQEIDRIDRYYNSRLTNYEQTITKRIEEHGVPNDFYLWRRDLLSNALIKPQVFERIEKEVIDNYTKGLREAYCGYLFEYGYPLPADIRLKLEPHESALKLSGEQTEKIYREELANYEKEEKAIKGLIFEHFRKYGETKLVQLKEQVDSSKFNFDSLLIQSIVKEQKESFERDLKDFDRLIFEYLHQNGDLEDDQITNG